jgi:hypothetical protein
VVRFSSPMTNGRATTALPSTDQRVAAMPSLVRRTPAGTPLSLRECERGKRDAGRARGVIRPCLAARNLQVERAGGGRSWEWRGDQNHATTQYRPRPMGGGAGMRRDVALLDRALRAALFLSMLGVLGRWI